MSNPAVHNPDNLASPGDPPWRFLLKGEKIAPDEDQFWLAHASTWELTANDFPTVPTSDLTYRTTRPLPTTQPPASPSVCRHGFPLSGACPKCDSVQATAGDALENAPAPGETPLTDAVRNDPENENLDGLQILSRMTKCARQLERRAIEAETRCAELERAQARLHAMEQVLLNLADVSIFYTEDSGQEDDIGEVPEGWNMRCPENCSPSIQINAPTFPQLLDAIIAWKKAEDAALQPKDPHPTMNTKPTLISLFAIAVLVAEIIAYFRS